MRKAMKWLALTLSFVVIISVGYYGYSLYSSLNGLHKGGAISNIFDGKKTENLGYQEPASTYVPPEWVGKDRVNILLLGGDSRGKTDGEIPRSDSIMIASIDPVTKKAALFSILRDTYVAIPGHGKERINAALAYGGPNLAVETVSNFTGLEIQYYVYTDFQGFMSLVESIGGIDIDVEKDMDYEDAWDGHEFDIHLKKGYQHLDGKTALQYVRFRHDATSDFTRTERQRKFMTAVAQKMQTTTNILKLPKIISAMDPYIETNLSVNDMLRLGTLGYKVLAGTVTGQQLPPTDLVQDLRVGGAQVVGTDEEAVRAFIQDFLEKQLATPEPSSSTAPSGSTAPSSTPPGA
ncbi:LCP family protein [Gorillibacterium timonense]|uniref:LCP family protein n=1 Tax=Gorillibacterium timonense TaxID=1689269 RepID=UPI00071C342F|nr:LCP family protein [Gorillibacterium timonense]